jgi:hypothetical protein
MAACGPDGTIVELAAPVVSVVAVVGVVGVGAEHAAAAATAAASNAMVRNTAVIVIPAY